MVFDATLHLIYKRARAREQKDPFGSIVLGRTHNLFLHTSEGTSGTFMNVWSNIHECLNEHS